MSVGPIEDVHRQLGISLQLRLDLRQIVFRDIEYNGDWLELGDNDEGSAAAGEYGVARIHEPQSNPAVYRRDNVAVLQLHLVVRHGALVRLDVAFVLDDRL